ncbi:hypothetical protein WHR41_04328 [Cladosporium halotolerans]|uniref:RING zinc finger-like domain-containing protein n=1 Tax=Cladosporium halotolerans TaxID=1052096 RepID=A0AB34KUB8_9PEZI
MPPRPGLQTSFSVADVNNEVVCPLRNQDGSHCRKRCLGEKRYRSMQEHIRRAHPEYYIPKLPATKESFELMITSPPHELPQDTSPQQNHVHHPVVPQHSDPSGYGHMIGQHDGGYYTAGDNDAAVIFNSMQAQQRSSDEYRRGSLIPAASAAAALAQLHYHRGAGGDSDWAGDNIGQNYYAEQNNDMKPQNYHVDPTLDEPPFMQDPTSFPATTGQDQPGLLPSSLARSPPDRNATLPPLQRSHSRQHARPRNKSLTQQARMAKHERKRSKDSIKRSGGERKLFSGEPTPAALYGKRWEDLIDAATSATEEEGSRDLTPIPASPYQSPQAASRTSVPPPFALGSQFQSFQASPLNRALTPPTADSNLDLQQYTSVDSSLSSSLSHQHHNSTDSGSQFNIMPPGAMDSTNTSPMFAPAQPVQIYCAGCRRLSILKDSYACTNCICGLCGTCVEALVENQRNGRMSGCPRCSLNYGSFKQFQLDVR